MFVASGALLALVLLFYFLEAKFGMAVFLRAIVRVSLVVLIALCVFRLIGG